MLKTWGHNKLQTLYLQFYFKGSGLLTCRGLASVWYISSIGEMPAHSLLFQKDIHCFPVFLLDYIEAAQKICLYVFVICNDDASQVFFSSNYLSDIVLSIGNPKMNKTKQNTVPYFKTQSLTHFLSKWAWLIVTGDQ